MRIAMWGVLVGAVLGCGRPGSLQVEPNTDFAAVVKVTPEAGPFNGDVVLTFESSPDATIYFSTNGLDPRTNAEGRVSGTSGLTLPLKATTTVKYFASANGKDGPLMEGLWVRAGGTRGTVSGTVVVGNFATGQELGVFRNTSLQTLGQLAQPGEVPFVFTGVSTGTHRLTAIADRNHDGMLARFLDYQSDTKVVEVDLDDPFKAGPEGIKLYLGASSSGLGTLKGVISLPQPPPAQNLQVSVLDPGALTGGLDAMALLQQLQGGYRIFTNATDTSYPYVVTDLQPGQAVPVASLLGFGNGGIALNLLANPLRPVTIVADEEAEANFAFGPVRISGTVVLGETSAPDGNFSFGLLGAKTLSFSEGGQAVLMPVIFTQDTLTQTTRASYSGAAFRANSTISFRVFTGGANALTAALAWVVNPLASDPPHATVATQNSDVSFDINVP